MPKTLSEAQVEALLAAPDVETPLGLRDRTMLELLYASGLRVSELVDAEDGQRQLRRGRAARHRQGQQGAAGAVRRGGARLDRALPRRGAGRDPRPAQSSDALFVTGRGGPMTRQMFWKLVKAHALRAGDHRAALAAHAAPCLRDPPAEPRRRPARGADAARPRRHLDDDDLHPRRARAAEAAARAAPSARLNMHSASPIRLQLLGAPRLLRDEQVLHVGSRKALAMLAVIALEAGVSRVRLAGWLWPEVDAAGARRNLRRELFRLRKLGVVIAEAADGALAVDPAVAVDALQPVARRRRARLPTPRPSKDSTASAATSSMPG